ncbi:MAG: DUF6323 family protein [Oscillospiraceae bacterium]
MDNQFSITSINHMLKLQTITELRDCNEYTQQFGLSLTDTQIHQLAEKRFEALEDNGRVEFGEGILKKLIRTFCDSPYLTQINYEETMEALQDSFYYFKNESEDLLSDDELIEFMKDAFDTVCEGSIDYLNSTSLEKLCRDIRNGDQDANEETFE